MVCVCYLLHVMQHPIVLIMDVPQAWHKLTAFIAGCFGFLISTARNYIVVHLSSQFVRRKLFEGIVVVLYV